MAIKTFRRWLTEQAPPWLHGQNGQAWLSSIGLMYDALFEMAVFALGQRFILSPACTTDSLGFAGQDRSLPKLPGETWAQYRTRLHQAWPAWEFAGSSTTIKEQLSILGLTADIRETHDAGWDWPGLPSWRHFWVVVRVHQMSPVPVWGGFDWGDGTVYGGDAQTLAQVLLLRRIIRKFKPAHMQCQSVIVVHDLTAWDAATPSISWEDPNNRPSSAIATWWPGE